MPEASVLDTLLSAWKIEGRAPPPEAETALAAYESLLAARTGQALASRNGRSSERS